MIFMNFHRFRGPGLPTFANGKKRPVAPLETFTRSQLVAISSIFMDFHDFHGFSNDFMRFHGFQGSGLGAGCYFIDFHGFV